MKEMTSTQKRYLRHILYGAGVGVAHTIFCWACYYVGLFRLEAQEFMLFFSIVWSGHLIFIGFIMSGYNMRLKDPSMMLFHMLWSLGVFLISAYLLDRMRISVMMMYLAIMLIGSFGVRFKGFLGISILAIAGYGVVLYFIGLNRPESLYIATEFLQELVQWGAMGLMMIIFAFLGADISGVRRALGSKNKELNVALTRIKDIAIRDELTGLYNRRHMAEILENQKGMADRGQHDFSVCYLDLDHFKQINDTYGHNIGDEVLKIYAKICQAQVRNIDYVARFGGEEFVLVLSKTNIEGAKYVAERIRKEIENYNFQTVAPGLNVTVSIGVTQYYSYERTEATISRADNALYRVKNSGRNKVLALEEKNRNTDSKNNLSVVKQIEHKTGNEAGHN